MAGISAIIPNWNRGDLLGLVLRDLAGQTRPPDEILVVDNGSNDDSVQRAERLGARVIQMGVNTGFARSVNRGIAESRAEWIAILNNDVELEDNWLERLQAAAQLSGSWFATGKILRAQSRETIDGTFDAVCRGGCAWRCGEGRKDQAVFSSARAIALCPFTAALFRKRLFDEVGVLDEEFESYLEDIDFGLRCAVRGFSGRYVPEAVAYHLGSATRGKWHPLTVKQLSRNQVFLIAKHYPAKWLWRFGWAAFIAQSLFGLAALRRGTGVAYLRGKLEGLRRFRTLRPVHPQENAMPAILDESEALLRKFQEHAGFDLFWRLYFLLT